MCLYEKLGVLLFSTDPNVKPQVSLDALIASFLNSVGNNRLWEPIIKKAFNRCFDDRFGTSDGYLCDVIPSSLESVICCTYKETFLKCPNYNPNGISSCKETREYLEMCYEVDYY